MFVMLMMLMFWLKEVFGKLLKMFVIVVFKLFV